MSDSKVSGAWCVLKKGISLVGKVGKWALMGAGMVSILNTLSESKEKDVVSVSKTDSATASRGNENIVDYGSTDNSLQCE